jgi:NADH:ubiquinone oxidoreductase subunit F (NADH-binding)
MTFSLRATGLRAPAEAGAAALPSRSVPADGFTYGPPIVRGAFSGEPAASVRLLAGPLPSAGAESLAAHRARLGPLPSPGRGRLVGVMESSGLLGRGGAGFPVGRKWRTVAERPSGGAVVLANGAEGEPISRKDRSLMALRPHLVIDGALLAADAVGADEIVLYVGTEHVAARAALAGAIAERRRELWLPVRIVEAPVGYVSGEESAAVHYVNARDARPTAVPPRPFERGVRGLPTVVQNVESLAQAALIGRYGDAWYRSVGRGPARGTAMVTVSGSAARPGVREVELGTTLAEVAEDAEVDQGRVSAVLLGGYFGSWIPADEAWSLSLDPDGLRRAGRSFGCGVMAFLPAETCGVVATTRIITYMAGQSAKQCGPCVFGLASVADALGRLAGSSARPDDLARIERWSGMIKGRGGCRHPDGAIGLLQSGLRVFAEDFGRHQRGRPCVASRVFAGAH